MENQKLSLLEKSVCVALGPVLGMLPPRKQLELTKGNYEKACLLSSSSRIFNSVWSAYAAVSLAAKVFGADIDPMPYNALTYIGIPVALNTMIRELSFGVHFYLDSPFSSYNEPWGEPIISWMDYNKNPKWYEGLENNLEKK